MRKFDTDEQNIYDMFSKISVDSSNLAEQVKNRLETEQPCTTTKGFRRWRRSVSVAMVLSVVLVATAAAAALGNFDWFMEKFNPSFGNIVEPVQSYSEDQGIRMEIIGAKKYDNRAIVYLSLQDITGQNRLTERTEFRDGLSVKTNTVKQDSNSKGDTEIFGISWGRKMIYFDEETNTIYYELNITVDSGASLADPLELGSFLVYFDSISYDDEPISISLMDIGEGETIPIEENHILAGSALVDEEGLFERVLTPGYYGDMPHGEKDQWISNIGIIDGKLHVQIGKIFNQEFGSDDGNISLRDAQGNFISYDENIVFLSDEDNNLIDMEKENFEDMEYRYEEFVFSVDPEELKEYILSYSGSVSSGVEGRWDVAANLEDDNKNMRIWEDDIIVGNHHIEHIMLSPLGVQAMGSYTGDVKNMAYEDILLEIETVDGTISLQGGIKSYSPNHSFDSVWNTKTPIDVTKVKALIIDGTRVPVK